MLTLYVICLILGGFFVALSIFGGGDLDADAPADVDFDADFEAAAGEEIGASSRFLSLRSAVFFAAFFGLSGTLFTLLGVSGLLTPFFAVAAGLFAAASLHHLMLYLGQNETGSVPDFDRLEGAMAEVVVDISEGRSGKIALKGGDRVLQLIAKIHDGAELRQFHVGDEVVIVDVHGGVAHIAGTRFLT